ncbi:hypothetical protein BP6252_12492 [Coleophoma cylindrospora]|uniref:Uncharacterized protein n=1 Tax=Coleophoma cylindrospora TaxID=1849047 RepID=A0A3D8QC14_9HELO|nr:hypothetical protein BP6252_12492 [Coleophoma cylindrospora]
MENNSRDAGDLLYHIKRTIIEYAKDPSGSTRITDILSTYIDLKAAKDAARLALLHEGYLKDDFEVYEEKNDIGSWEHGDGVLVFAKAPAGQHFEISIDTKPNTNKFEGDSSGIVTAHLEYVLQTTIFYNKDRTGSAQITEVQGTFSTRKAAIEAAKVALLDGDVTKEDFAEYDEKDEDIAAIEWPYGEDVYVHAVLSTGENFLVAVKSQPGQSSS